ncbi:hypothetical protein AWH56_021175 [Anaerobacillus isosaccharinicus]|uniref:Uncharacterized protein n=1 Tax=Anaerobacillus isosaccharinicus TaxID=1532552 RepID=A0A1S2LKF5_9BACI|nr:hypothetical protein [Anaerobacillus isosaccharinicus]MBA5586578.1 hypothetical protein [Anaerobacillus isosaccharinicus]QOY35186.1 hypothetical protein AWH56_021175 [Anaerobacillus isosaccharinicus]
MSDKPNKTNRQKLSFQFSLLRLSDRTSDPLLSKKRKFSKVIGLEFRYFAKTDPKRANFLKIAERMSDKSQKIRKYHK